MKAPHVTYPQSSDVIPLLKKLRFSREYNSAFAQVSQEVPRYFLSISLSLLSLPNLNPIRVIDGSPLGSWLKVFYFLFFLGDSSVYVYHKNTYILASKVTKPNSYMLQHFFDFLSEDWFNLQEWSPDFYLHWTCGLAMFSSTSTCYFTLFGVVKNISGWMRSYRQQQFSIFSSVEDREFPVYFVCDFCIFAYHDTKFHVLFKNFFILVASYGEINAL